ncbi:hypothetical protein [Youngiibacter fragilis]|uniref:Uncharacterized protein n=1 Tax=Youngiibacter fragilis 232.1 TaxID=994573 RepID=V7I4L5_9CLOT|nr:hypothetical protein [Youngiibacter fragilis]ETA80828.1 hypothetical protein T472_0209645 [Youngiibacter fragilis 232.1]
MPNVGQELLNVPFPEMVLKLASAIAEGQFKLDMVSCRIAKMMGDPKQASVSLPDLTSDDNETIKTSLIGAGFQPTFYQFTDTIIEVKMAITMNQTFESTFSTSASGGFMCFAASVNASFSSKYSYSVEGSSLLRTKITPLPPNTFMQRILDMKAQKLQQEFQLKLKQQELEMKKAEAALKVETDKIEEEIKKLEDTKPTP